ncbi:hypothetical protein [Ethanoligenens harbinense]|uniref:hypothetical protein n=1 Tax=Ethanoligenens harbinense TaxID=253239 RepID=UPI0003120A52|nr:hypothetical protein [Ethanoligenens harbinense]
MASDEEAEHFGAAARQARADWQMRLAERAAGGSENPAACLEQVFGALFGRRR